MKSDIRELTQEIVDWADELMPGRLPEFAFKKLLEEIDEWKDRPADGHEAADVMILLLDVCHLVGIDIVKAVHHKMRINRERRWEVDGRGLMSHVKPKSELAVENQVFRTGTKIPFTHCMDCRTLTFCQNFGCGSGKFR